MKTKWLLEAKVFDDEVLQMVQEIEKQGFSYKIYERIYSNEENDIISLFDTNDCVVFYGSLGMAQQIKRFAPWIPGVYCNLSKFECTYYYPFFGDYLLNKDYVMAPFGDILRRKQFLNDLYGESIFIRPNSAFKIFTGTVIKNWNYDLKYISTHTISSEKLSIVSKPQKILTEWRLVVAKNKVISGSQYIKNDEIEHGLCPDYVMDYGQKVVNEVNYEPEPVWCLDVCEIDDGLRVLEVGAFSTCGLYACPKEPIIREVSKIAWEEWEEYNNMP